VYNFTPNYLGNNQRSINLCDSGGSPHVVSYWTKVTSECGDLLAVILLLYT
jgi:hypothetical protein